MNRPAALLLAIACSFSFPRADAQTVQNTEQLARFMQKYRANNTSFSRYRFSTNASTLRDPAVNFWDAQLAAMDSSIMGRPNDALLYFPIASPPPKTLPDPHRYRAQDAAEWIIQHVKDHRVVMLNEVHHLSQTRLLTLSLLKPLHDAGFRYLALETLTNNGTNPVPNGYPEEKSGEYTRDPLLGDLVREALRLGFELVPYEASPADIGNAVSRESAQARNLTAFLKSHPDARLVVHAGYAHIAKTTAVKISGARTMATALSEATHARILSIDQATLTPKSKASREALDAQATLNTAFPSNRPVVLLSNSDGTAWSAVPGAYDASVLLPASDVDAIRPDWLSLGGVRRKVPVNLVHCENLWPCLVQAFVAGEPNQAIPADQLVITVPSERTSTLYLRDGSYRLRYVTNEDQVTFERRIQVPGGTGEVAPQRLP